MREPPVHVGIAHARAPRQRARDEPGRLASSAPRMTRRSLESSGLRNGEQTACQTADFTPEPGGKPTSAR